MGADFQINKYGEIIRDKNPAKDNPWKNKVGLWIILGVMVIFVVPTIFFAIVGFRVIVHNVGQEDLHVKGVSMVESQEYVDLGLPSGTLWATENAGGDGVYYTYAEAVSKFGNNLPTKEQFEELHEKCTFQLTSSGYRIVGPNKNSIHLPLEGSRQGYWYNKSNKGNMHGLFFSSGVNELDRNYGFSVRLVKD